PYWAAFGEGVAVFALFLLPAPSKSLLPSFLQKRRAAFGEGVSLNTLFLFPAFFEKSFASFSSEKEVFCLLFFRKVRLFFRKVGLIFPQRRRSHGSLLR
ncbi:MAG: hypothetical protein II771_09780, partial [Clostridia bacterium]|nr:hypothetical protein [Clostridia bacterium]